MAKLARQSGIKHETHTPKYISGFPRPRPGERGFKTAHLEDGTEVEITYPGPNRHERRHPEESAWMKTFKRALAAKHGRRNKAKNRRRNEMSKASRRRNRHGK